MTQLSNQKETQNVQDLLLNISDYIEDLQDEHGVTMCPKHNIEHTGKNAYSIGSNSFLYKETGDKKYRKRYEAMIERVCGHLVQDPDSGAWIYWPGRLGVRNMSNSAIDSGCASDALASILLDDDQLPEVLQEKIRDTLYKNADTYLCDAAIDKEMINQRLWAATGLAAAYKVHGVEKWKECVLKSIEKSLDQMFDDGMFPYNPSFKEYGVYRGIYDSTTYYHSRHIGFILYALECIGESADQYKDRIGKALDVLVAMYEPSGYKTMALEAKRWYWLSNYEVVSHSFDLYALSKGQELFPEKNLNTVIARSYEQFKAHMLEDGGVTSHFGLQTNFQCRTFWNTHCIWIARCATEIEAACKNQSSDVTKDLSVQVFENMGLVDVSTPHYRAKIRVSKQSSNAIWGPYIGGASLVYIGENTKTAQNRISYFDWQQHIACNWSVKKWSLKEHVSFLKANKKELKNILYYARIEFRAKHFAAGFVRLWECVSKIVKGDWVYSSAFTPQTSWKYEEGTLVAQGDITNHEGNSIEGYSMNRSYTFEFDSLQLEDEISITSDTRKVVTYTTLPEAEVFIKTDVPHKAFGSKIYFFVSNPTDIVITSQFNFDEKEN